MQIVTDSTADLSPELIEKYNIKVVPLLVTIGDKTYYDGVDITQKELFQLVDKHKTLPKTAAPSVGTFAKIFEEIDDDILYIGLSSALSATIQNAKLAQQYTKHRVEIIDSRQLSTGIGLLVLKAADMRDQGYSLTDIATNIAWLVGSVRTSFVIDTLKYLYMGGRCTALQSFASTALRIRPIIEVRSDGTLGVKQKIRGKRRKAIDSMLEEFRSLADKVDRTRVAITHTGCDEEAAYMAEEVQKIVAPKEIVITDAGCVISSHCGPGTIGLLYLLNG